MWRSPSQLLSAGGSVAWLCASTASAFSLTECKSQHGPPRTRSNAVLETEDASDHFSRSCSHLSTTTGTPATHILKCCLCLCVRFTYVLSQKVLACWRKAKHVHCVVEPFTSLCSLMNSAEHRYCHGWGFDSCCDLLCCKHFLSCCSPVIGIKGRVLCTNDSVADLYQSPMLGIPCQNPTVWTSRLMFPWLGGGGVITMAVSDFISFPLGLLGISSNFRWITFWF